MSDIDGWFNEKKPNYLKPNNEEILAAVNKYIYDYGNFGNLHGLDDEVLSLTTRLDDPKGMLNEALNAVYLDLPISGMTEKLNADNFVNKVLNLDSSSKQKIIILGSFNADSYSAVYPRTAGKYLSIRNSTFSNCFSTEEEETEFLKEIDNYKDYDFISDATINSNHVLVTGKVQINSIENDGEWKIYFADGTTSTLNAIQKMLSLDGTDYLGNKYITKYVYFSPITEPWTCGYFKEIIGLERIFTE